MNLYVFVPKYNENSITKQPVGGAQFPAHWSLLKTSNFKKGSD